MSLSIFTWLCVSLLSTTLTQAFAPTGLLCDFQKHPALGVRKIPRFSWIVPPCANAADQSQTAYQVTVTSAYGTVWDSGKQSSNESTYVPYSGPPLNASSTYEWSVATWTTSCESDPSSPAAFTTTLLNGWDPTAKFISTKETTAIFGYFRKEVNIPSNVVFAVAHVAALDDSKLLSGYKLYIDDTLINVGPGRGESPVWADDANPGQFNSFPFTTLDVTAALRTPGLHVLALQAMHTNVPTAILQLSLHLSNGEAVSIVTDSTWMALNGDTHRQPREGQGHTSAGTHFIEHIDARNEPQGWRSQKFTPSQNWTNATAAAPTADQQSNLHQKMQPPMQVTENVPVQSIRPISSQNFIADFGLEFQGGLKLEVENGTAGQIVSISCGEALNKDSVEFTWDWVFDWTLRDGAQILEQHKYMECRFASLNFSGTAPKFTLSAWKVNYPWSEEDSSFTSSNATLDAVYNLCRYTTHAAALDTYTDSNTRERNPYEADGIIFASARLLTQRDYLFGRHSHSFVIHNPTWPVEWQQITPLLGWQDFMATGQPDLALAFTQEMHDRTKISYLDSSSGLLNTAKMGSRHIVDWMPDNKESDQTVARGEFTASDHTSVSNTFAAHGLDLLAQMMEAGGRSDNASQFAKESSDLMTAIKKYMWNGTAFCDGICSEVNGNSLLMTNIFTLAFGLVEDEYVPSAWSTVADWGLEQIGDYGAFWYQLALAGSYYANEIHDAPDDGTAMYIALTKCDTYSWCSGLRDDNLTTTRESWHDGTYSHGWGASGVVGVTLGIMGVHQTSPGFATFTVRPKLGGLTNASITVPTLRGYINVTASPGSVDVNVPCNTLATLCIPRSSSDSFSHLDKATKLLLDGTEVGSVLTNGHLCVDKGVSCGAAGKPRQLRVQ